MGKRHHDKSSDITPEPASEVVAREDFPQNPLGVEPVPEPTEHKLDGPFAVSERSASAFAQPFVEEAAPEVDVDGLVVTGATRAELEETIAAGTAENDRLREHLAAGEEYRQGASAIIENLTAENDKLREQLVDAVAAASDAQALRARFASLQGSIWEISWQGDRAWVAAPTIEEAIAKVRAKHPKVNITVAKDAGIKLVF